MIPAHLQNRTIDQLRSTQETIRCFLVNQTGEGYESIVITEDGKCVGDFNYHRSEVVITRYYLDESGKYPDVWATHDERRAAVIPYCTRCGNHEFSEQSLDKVSGSKGRVWERADTGERADNLNDFGPGAMWEVTWYKNSETGLFWHPGFENKQFDHAPLCVRTPGGDWVIDSRCNNCSLPDDLDHKCWPRAGSAPKITVSKTLGPTCSTGGGSVITGNYHGFLRDGFLVKC